MTMALTLPARILSALTLTIALAACGGPEVRFGDPAPVPSERVRAVYRSLEVMTVTMPSYALTEEIHAQDATGAVTPLGPLWTDEPDRAVTLQLARDLGAITGALVAPEPWPFRDPAAARIDVRVEDFLAVAGGGFRLSGQYFVAPDYGGRNRSGRFSIEVPIDGAVSAAAIARARGEAVSRLAIEIAQAGLR